MCIFTLKRILDFCVASSSPLLYLCYIDASKAFDHVNVWCLSDKLIKRKVPIILVRFMVWYCTWGFLVRWRNCLSSAFTTSNVGVRQGGIVSPLFFSIHMDDLSNTLNNANVGCTMNEGDMPMTPITCAEKTWSHFKTMR